MSRLRAFAKDIAYASIIGIALAAGILRGCIR